MAAVLVLRPEPGASETLARARQLGVEAIACPLFEVEAVHWELPEAGAFDGLMITSANAIRFAGRDLEKVRGLPVYAVGAATAKAARDAGLAVAAIGNLDVDHLLASIDGDRRFLHLCGVDRREPNAPQPITPVPVYRAREIDVAVGDVGGMTAMIHSPRAGRRFAALVEARETVSIAAISEAAAVAVGSGWKRVEVAAEPTDAALLALAASLCNKPQPK